MCNLYLSRLFKDCALFKRIAVRIQYGNETSNKIIFVDFTQNSIISNRAKWSIDFLRKRWITLVIVDNSVTILFTPTYVLRFTFFVRSKMMNLMLHLDDLIKEVTVSTLLQQGASY